MYDLAITNGYIITSEGKKRLDIGIRNGMIAGMSLPGMLGDAKRIIDIPGQYIFPGGIDVHVHMDDLGAEDMEDWRHGSYAAAAGGVTTVVDMPIDSVPSTIDRDCVKRKLDRIEGNAYIDYMLWGGLTTDNLDAVMPMLEEGVVGLKSFLTDSGADDFVRTCDPVLLEAMKIAAKEGFPIIVHAENEELNKFYTEKYKGHNNWREWSKMQPEAGELEAVTKCALFAGVTGARVHIAHVSSARSVKIIQEAKKQGVKITCETCPHYLLFSEEDYEDKGAMLKCAPPIRSRQNRQELWKELEQGNIDMISSDHSPSPTKNPDDTVDEAWAGISGIQSTLLALYSEGYCKGRMELKQIAEVFSTNAARLLGIDDRKGSIELGKDADLVILNPWRDTVFDKDQIKTKAKNSVYEDSCFRGFIEKTFLRGGEVKNHEPRGHYICR